MPGRSRGAAATVGATAVTGVVRSARRRPATPCARRRGPRLSVAEDIGGGRGKGGGGGQGGGRAAGKSEERGLGEGQAMARRGPKEHQRAGGGGGTLEHGAPGVERQPVRLVEGTCVLTRGGHDAAGRVMILKVVSLADVVNGRPDPSPHKSAISLKLYICCVQLHCGRALMQCDCTCRPHPWDREGTCLLAV